MTKSASGALCLMEKSEGFPMRIKMPEREAPARIHFFRYVLHNDTD